MPLKNWAPGDVLTASDLMTFLMRQAVIVCTSGTRPGPDDRVNGMTIHETDTGRRWVWNGADWVPETSISVTRTGLQSLSNSTTMQDDDTLFLPVARNTVYQVDALLIVDGPASGDVKVGWTVPSGSRMDWYGDGTDPAATATGFFGLGRGWQDETGTPSSATINTSTRNVLNPRGVLRVGGTSGTLQLRWAQVTASGSATRMRDGSTLTLTRLA